MYIYNQTFFTMIVRSIISFGNLKTCIPDVHMLSIYFDQWLGYVCGGPRSFYRYLLTGGGGRKLFDTGHEVEYGKAKVW